MLYPSRVTLAAAAFWCLLALATIFAPGLGIVLLLGGVALIATLAGDAYAISQLASPTLERELPPNLQQGRSARAALRIRNAASRPVELEVFDELPADLGAGSPHRARFQLAAGAQTVFEYSLRPERRGERPLGVPFALQHSPLGLWQRRAVGAVGERVLVRPNTSKLLHSEALDAKRVLAMLGVKPVRRRGEGSEFETLREYVVGDDPRHIDWKASARRGRLTARVHRHERSHTVVIAVDASRLMGADSGEQGSATKLDRAVEAALALAYTALIHGDRVGLAVFDSEVRGFIVPRAQRSGLGPMIELLSALEARRVEADHAELVRVLAARQRQRALVVVLTDFVEAEADRFATPLAVLARRHRALLVALRDPIYAELDATAERTGPELESLHRRIAIDDLLHERDTALASLRRMGVQTLDLPPHEITAPMLNRYLALRFGAEG